MKQQRKERRGGGADSGTWRSGVCGYNAKASKTTGNSRQGSQGRGVAKQSKGSDDRTARRRFDVRGRVQGVGFRPFVYRIAGEAGLAGHVGNSVLGAFIEVEGETGRIERFVELLENELPPLAEITCLVEKELPVAGDDEFFIMPSTAEGKQTAQITPDAATCDDCLREMMCPADRRHGYPFINCTNCGPRYSIITGVPYDRAGTTMHKFKMCPECLAEYTDPSDRRFHAQPNACAVCGPRVWLVDGKGAEVAGDAVKTAANWLREGRILAIKGLGGFHLACRADDDAVVGELRRRKDREAKPLAMMVASLDEAERIVVLDAASTAAMTRPARPIVLAPKRPAAAISGEVAPSSGTFGVMLPYTPLHFLLFAEGLPPLVMTSGNPSEEPLCSQNAEALERLGGIADGFLLHDRDIERRIDDSVVMTVSLPGDAEESRIVPLRRARGFVPAPVRVEVEASEGILAVGGDMKSAVCILCGRDAVLSEHLGELENPAAYRNFAATVDCFEKLLDVRPALLACDMHPEYVSTRYALDLPLRATPVQHHHAHVVGCMAENGLSGEVIGVACDGTGYGTDGTSWGCEVLVANEADFQRAGHLRTYPLFGGDVAARETWRPAVGLLRETYGEDWLAAAEAVTGRIDAEALSVAAGRLAGGRLRRTSSLGRLFDAAAFILGVCERNRFEAEAPMMLETLAGKCPEAAPFECGLVEGAGGAAAMDFAGLIRGLVEGVGEGAAPAQLARAFHETVAAMLADCVGVVAERSGLKRVVLTGGCFANRLLLCRLWELLVGEGLDAYIHTVVPPGDGGIALGQAAVAAARLERGEL